MDKEEALELIISWLTLSVAFAWNLDPSTFAIRLPLYMLAVGTAFVFHELAHRFVAHMFGYPARFIMWKEGLLLALGLSILTEGRFVFAAPGAVYVFGHPRERENALISLAGPLANAFVAYTALLLSTAAPAPLAYLLFWIAKVNAFIGLFNMLPIFPLDGSKVLPWNPLVYAVAFLLLAYPAFLM